MLPLLTVIPAGAGSGKTYTLQQKLGEWVANKQVSPERIVAVTFTEAAAAELRERIRAKLLAQGLLEEALRLDDAYISTIHGFGHRLLTEFAFEGGLSPHLRLLSDDEENTLIRQALARTDQVDRIIANLSRYGYRYDFNSGKTAEECFRDELLDFVRLLRAAGWHGGEHDYAEHARTWINEKYGFTGDPAPLTENLHRAVLRLLDAYPYSLAEEFGSSATATREFQSDFIALKRAADRGALEHDWGLWKALASLRMSKKGCALPEEYDALAAKVIQSAEQLPSHPGPRDQAIGFVEAMIAAGQEVLDHYAEAKREAGLIDFNDMIAMAVALLRDHPEVLQTLVSRIDCLVVDEFQDTNPLQFALLWLLKEAGIPTVIVGDLKQAIMGFQGADPRLFAAITSQFSEHSAPLQENWRSQPALMNIINDVGESLFGTEYVALQPRGKESRLSPLEVVSFEARAKKEQHMIRAAFVGQRIKELLEDAGQIIVDRRTGHVRRLMGGDVAVLCPTHDMLAQYADILRQLGLRVRLEEEGWYESRIIQLMWQALSYIANPGDRHAALYLSTTELGTLTLEAALHHLIEQGAIQEPLFQRLDAIAQQSTERTVYALVADTIAALGLYDTIATWPDGEQARANLLRLQAEAGEFMDANREALASGGYHGAGLQTFLAWLAERVQKKNGDKQPAPRVIDEEAVELVTWHSSKGREWPVVAVCGFEKSVSASLPCRTLAYSDFDDLSLLLEKAHIQYDPHFHAEESKERFLAELQRQQEMEAKRLLYVALTRPRDKLIVEWPAYLASSKAKTPTYWSILTVGEKIRLAGNTLQIGKSRWECRVVKGDNDYPQALEWIEKGTVLSTVGRRAIESAPAPAELTLDIMSPSLMKTAAVAVSQDSLRREIYAQPLTIEASLRGAELGSLLHRCYEVHGAQGANPQVISTILSGVVDEAGCSQVVEQINRFESFIAERFAATHVAREVPLLAMDEKGSVISGTADLLIETTDGAWIIDHKSDQVDDPVIAFAGYLQQLLAYQHAVEQAGSRVCGYGINWIRRGEAMLMQII